MLVTSNTFLAQPAVHAEPLPTGRAEVRRGRWTAWAVRREAPGAAAARVEAGSTSCDTKRTVDAHGATQR